MYAIDDRFIEKPERTIGVKTVTATLRAGTKVEISDGHHTWAADEPPEAKGTDTGPTPYELLMGALAACTCITMSLYCGHKGIPITSVRSSHSFERVPVDGEEGKDKKIEQITSTVTVEGELDEAQRKRLTQVAKRCPVHKSLANGVTIIDAIEFV